MEVKNIVGKVDDDGNISSYYHSGRNCNVGGYENIIGAKKALGQYKRHSLNAKIFKVTNLEEVK